MQRMSAPAITATSDFKGVKSGLVYNGASAMTNCHLNYIAAPSGTGTITNKFALVTEANAGSVGVGTTSPGSPLHIVGSNDIEIPSVPSLLALSDASDPTKALRLGYDDSLDRAVIVATDLGTAWKDIIIAPYGGSVGIGTTSPRGAFDVDGSGDIYLVDDPSAATSQSLYLPGHIYLAPFGETNISYLQARRKDDTGTSQLQIRTWNSGNATEAIRILGDGSVGIGNTSPASGLHIGASAGGSGKGYITEEDVEQTPTLTVDGQMAIYSKGNKICIAKRVSGTTRYTSIDMSANGNSWSTSTTTAP